jgi:two-component system NtrC family sensor kinase
MFTAIAMYKRHGQEPRVAEKTVSLLERGLDQIRHIVSALLVEVKAEPRDLDPRDLQDLAELLAPRAREKRLRLTWPESWEGALPLPVGPMRQVLINLVLNAIQAAPEEGAVTVELEKQQRTLTIRVANEGGPIPEERLERLFEPFVESGWGGSGLGLWITDQTVRQLHGRIQVSSDTGRTVFQVELPLEEGK